MGDFISGKISGGHYRNIAIYTYTRYNKSSNSGCFFNIWFIIWSKKKKLPKDLAICLAITIIVGTTYIGGYLIVFNNDIKEENIIKFEGKYTYTIGDSDSGDFIHLDGHRKTFVLKSCWDLDIEEGTYDGYIIYTKRTRWVLEMGVKTKDNKLKALKWNKNQLNLIFVFLQEKIKREIR